MAGTEQSKINGNGKILRLKTRARRWRTLHLVTGLVVGVWFVLMAVTGILVNHQTDWGLDEIEVSNAYLPDHYTDEFHPESTRLNIVLTDLHSGRFLGAWGRYVGDVIALLVLISVGSGFYAHFLIRHANRLGVQANNLTTEAVSRQAAEVKRRPASDADTDLRENVPEQPFRIH